MTSEVLAAVNMYESDDVGGPAQPLLTVAAYYLVFDVVFAMRLGDAVGDAIGRQASRPIST